MRRSWVETELVVCGVALSAVVDETLVAVVLSCGDPDPSEATCAPSAVVVVWVATAVVLDVALVVLDPSVDGATAVVVVGEDCETSVEVSLPEIVSTTSSGSIIAAASNKNLCSSARSKVAGRFFRSVGFSRCDSDAPIDRSLPYSKYWHFVIKRGAIVGTASNGAINSISTRRAATDPTFIS